MCLWFRFAAFFGLFFLALLPVCRGEGSADAPPQWISQEHAQKDTRQLIRLLDESHPDPYSAYGCRVTFKIAANELVSDLPPEGMVRGALVERLAEFLARIKDGHTFLDATAPQAQSTIVPFRFSVGPDGLFLSAWNVSALDGLLGAQLVSLNGLSQSELLARASRLRGAENESHARLNLRNELRTLEGLAKLLDSAPPATVTLRLRRQRAKVLDVAVPLPMPETLDSAIAGIPSLIEIGAALLEEMKRRQTKYLIVDLEENSGGVTSSALPLLHQIYGDASLADQSHAPYTTVYSPLYLQKFKTNLDAMRRERNHPDLQLGDFVAAWTEGDECFASRAPGTASRTGHLPATASPCAERCRHLQRGFSPVGVLSNPRRQGGWAAAGSIAQWLDRDHPFHPGQIRPQRVDFQFSAVLHS